MNVFSSSFSGPNEHIITNACILLPIGASIFSPLWNLPQVVFLQWDCSQSVKQSVIMWWGQFKLKENELFQMLRLSEIPAKKLCTYLSWRYSLLRLVILEKKWLIRILRIKQTYNVYLFLLVQVPEISYAEFQCLESVKQNRNTNELLVLLSSKRLTERYYQSATLWHVQGVYTRLGQGKLGKGSITSRKRVNM